MLLDFDAAATPLPPRADVCILGAGAAGITLAIELAAAGRTVIVLEGGGLDLEPRSQAIYNSELTGHAHHGIHDGRFRTWGGSTTRWGGQMLPLADHDFAVRDWVPGSGWPFPKSDLLPYYERALTFAGLRRVERDDNLVRKALGVTLPHLTPEFDQLYSRWLPERNLATLHARTLRESPRITVLFHANAVSLNLTPDSDALASVTIRGYSGRTTKVLAESYILALGGIESTRLLLQPHPDRTHPWQSNGLLGRHFQDHLTVNGIPLVSLDPAGLDPTLAPSLFGYVESRGFRFHNKLVLSQQQQQAQQTLNVAGTLSPFARENHSRDAAMQTARTILRSRQLPSVPDLTRLALQAPGIALDRLRSETSRWRRIMLTVHAEQSPRSASILSLTPDRDALGLLRTRLHWVIADAELATIRAYVRTAMQVFARQRLASVEPPHGFFEDDALLRSLCTDSYHHMGGTIISASPTTGIVDHDLRLHGIRNTYVCSSSVFPTSGFSNPTHTLMALALRLVNHLAAQTPGAPSVRFTGRVAEPPSLPTTSTPNESCHPEAYRGPRRAFSARWGGSPKHLLLKSPQMPGIALRPITLPNSTRTVPQLGFGCAYLLSPGLDAPTSRRLLDAAFDAGIRHFDAARLYGMGHTESLLGHFLADHPDATVATKFGIVPPTPAQRLVMSASRRLGHEWRRSDRARFTAAAARTSLETSLRYLRRDRIDLFLLHEATPEDLIHDDLLAFLLDRRAAGIIGEFGIGGDRSRVSTLHRDRLAYTPVLQFDSSILDPRLDLPGSYQVHYRVFASAATTLHQRLASDPALALRWSNEVGADLRDPALLASLLLRASLDAKPQTLTLFSTRTEDRIFACVAAATDPKLSTPSQSLLATLSHENLSTPSAPPRPANSLT